VTDVRVVTVVAAALLDGHGRVLMAERPEGRSMAGLWEFPGGKLERGETPEAALARELVEELGVAIEAPQALGFVSHGYAAFHLVMLLYAVRRWHGEPVGLLGQRLDWVLADRLDGLAMPAADYPLVPLVRAAAIVAPENVSGG
jgi:8-oxo-dGTP diphosphatase